MVNIKLQLPEGFLDGETRDGYYVSPKMKEVWAVELDLLNEFKRVCDKYNIQWYGDAGTILGAVRHKGMIPWDDDIDVMLMREEYEKLCSIAETEFAHPYFFQTEQTDPGSVRGHAQLRNSETTGILVGEQSMKLKINQGIFLDIFPIDNMPDDDDNAKEQVERIERLRLNYLGILAWTGRYVPSVKPIKRYLKVWARYFFKYYNKVIGNDYRKYYDEYEKEIQRYDGENTERVAKLVLVPFKKRRVWKRSWFSGTTFLPFEMFSLPVPSGYREILDCFYGDWHKYVVGTSTHGGVIFDSNKSYKHYIR